MNSPYHISVLLHECIEALNILPDESYADLTFGGGGHSRAILQKMKGGRLFAFDQDDDALRNLPNDNRLVFVNHNFRFLYRFLDYHKAIPLAGILADLGISSFQIDEGSKGFSTRFDGPLDMRMNQDQELTAEEIIMTYDAERLQKIFSEYGEVRNSKSLAAAIIQARETGRSFQSTAAFSSFLESVSMGNVNRYKAQVFQALRIEVNDEMGALSEMLEQTAEVIKPGGRLAIITFHSLEDRLVKNYMKSGSVDGELKKDAFGNIERPFKPLGKPIQASKDELKENKRSRSAKLRIAERI